MGRLLLSCLLVACGRVGFQTESVGSGASDATDAAGDGTGAGDGTASGISYVGQVVMQAPGMGATDTFSLQASAAGDAIAMLVMCSGSGAPSGVTVTAPGWTLVQLDPPMTDTNSQISAAGFVAVAPDTAATTVSLTWLSTNCNRGKTEIADEFAGTDPTSPIDAHAIAVGFGNCVTSVTTARAGDALWAGCYAATTLTSTGAGFTEGAKDAFGDYDEYELTSDPAGTLEQISFTNPSNFVIVAAALAPR